MSQAPHYLDVLTHEIGPRPASSDTERQAAEWLQDRFIEAGVPTELHDFDAPRSPQSARMFTYVLAPIALFGIGASFLEQMWVIHWLCWLLLAAMSVLTLLDFYGPKGPAGLIALLPKGPSQNIIARSIPSSYTPGEKPKKVILLANYDSELVSPLSGEAFAAIGRLLQAVSNLVVIIMPALALLLVLDVVTFAPTVMWTFRILLVLCIPGVLLLINQLIARIMNRYSPGANNNASGVAAVLAAADLLAEGQQSHSGHTTTTAAVKLAAAEAKAANAAKQSSKMPGIDYTSPTGASAKISAVPLAGVAQEEGGLSRAAAPTSTSATSAPITTAAQGTDIEQRFVDFETVEFSGLGDEAKVEIASSYAAMDDYDAQATFADDEPALATEVLDANIIGTPVATADDLAEPARHSSGRDRKLSRSERPKRGSGREGRLSKADRPRKEKKNFFSFGKKRHDAHYADDPSNWLGLDQDFDARKDGKSMGSWDNFGEGAAAEDDIVASLIDSLDSADESDYAPQTTDTALSPPPPPGDGVVDLTDSFAPLGGSGGEDDDHFAWKGGFAGDDPIEDSDYASAEAARIRRKVVDSLDVDLKEKEVWFVFTGAHYAERAGIRAFMHDYGDQLRDALFINISAVGSGDLYWSTKERFGRTYPSSARLTSMFRRLTRESQVRIKPWKKKALVSDAGPVLAAGRKAISITRLNDKGAPFALASSQDTAARLDSSKIDEVADLVCNLIREV